MHDIPSEKSLVQHSIQSESTLRTNGIHRLKRILICIAFLAFVFFASGFPSVQHFCRHTENRGRRTALSWKACGDGFDCTNVTVPLDYGHPDDGRTMSIAVVRYAATDAENRLGSIFINPGGPGGSGTSTTFSRGPTLARIFEGRYDIIGFDPRGINMTRPYVSCFDSQLQADIFDAAYNPRLDIPANLSSLEPGELWEAVDRQLSVTVAASESLYAGCMNRTGEAISYMGTTSVVRDIDTLARAINGDEEPINYWGFSYGTVIGQYLVKVLPAERLGRLIIDGVVNIDTWVKYPIQVLDQGLQDIEQVLLGFVQACSNTGNTTRCALADLKDMEILARIDKLLDDLYKKPQPVYGLPYPAVATTTNVRDLLFRDMYRSESWPELAEHLAQAIYYNNLTGIVNATMPRTNPEGADQPDDSRHSPAVVFCADAKPYDSTYPAPNLTERTDAYVSSIHKYGSRFGASLHTFSLCPPLSTAAPRFPGPFTMASSTLSTPMLILSNTYDPVTPLVNAQLALGHLRDNARLVTQVGKGAYGHCSLSAPSSCTLKVVRKFMLDGEVPEQAAVQCEVDGEPFAEPVTDDVAIASLDDQRKLVELWKELGKAVAEPGPWAHLR